MKLGLQSYSLRKMNYEKALETISKLGIDYVEAYPRHLPINEDINKVRSLHEKYNLRLIAHGVNHLSKNEKELDAIFDFARKAGIEVITADPDEDSLELVSDLAKQYDIKIGIHNHGPPHRWGSFKKIYQAIKNLDFRVGMCLDLAHLARYGENPIEAIETLRERVYDIHLKDVDAKGNDVIVGTGILDIRSFLKKLKELKLLDEIPIMIEYEPNPEDPINGITRSLDFVRGIISEL